MEQASREDYERLMTTREVAEFFRVEPKTVARWAREGKLSSGRTPGGGLRRYRESDVRAPLGGGR